MKRIIEISSTKLRLMVDVMQGYKRSHGPACACNECVLTSVLLAPAAALSRPKLSPEDGDSFEVLLSKACFEVDDAYRPERGRPRHFMADVLFGLVMRGYRRCSYRSVVPFLISAAHRGLITNVPYHSTLSRYGALQSTNKFLMSLWTILFPSEEPPFVEIGDVSYNAEAVADRIALLVESGASVTLPNSTGSLVVASAQELLRSIEALLPNSLNAEQKGDLCQDLMLAVLSGELSSDVAEIKPRIREYVRRHYKIGANKFRDVSIDAPLGDSDLTLAETLVG